MEQPIVLEYVQRKLEHYWSPDQIAGRAKQVEFRRQAERWPSRSTIYCWLNHPYRGSSAWKSYLRFANKRQRRHENEENASISIRDRPAAVVDRRQRYGEWEGDTVVGPKHQSAIVTVVDRKSGYILTRKACDRKVATACQATECSRSNPMTLDFASIVSNSRRRGRLVESGRYVFLAATNRP